MTERSILYEKQINQKDEYINKLEKKNLTQLEEFTKKKNELLQSMQEEN